MTTYDPTPVRVSCSSTGVELLDGRRVVVFHHNASPRYAVTADDARRFAASLLDYADHADELEERGTLAGGAESRAERRRLRELVIRLVRFDEHARQDADVILARHRIAARQEGTNA